MAKSNQINPQRHLPLRDFADRETNARAMLSDTPSLSIHLPTCNRVATNQPLTVGIDINHKFN